MGGQPSCTSQTNNDTPLPNGETVSIPIACPTLANPSVYGLTSFGITIKALYTDTSLQFIVTFDLNGGTSFTVTAEPYNGGEVVFLASVQGPSPANAHIKASVQANRLIVVVTNGMNALTYTIQFFFDIRAPFAGTPIIRADTPVAIFASLTGELPVPPSPDGTDSIPNITGMIHMTPDGKQVCQVDYTTVIRRDCSLITSSYVQYSPDIASVLIGLGCTVASKTGGNPIVVVYSVLRMILSSLVMCVDFSPEWLRRRYYKTFLKKLAKSEWKAFLAYFIDPEFGVTEYWLLFKE
jgi:hypothetical protein